MRALLILSILLTSFSSLAANRIKDIADIKGVRDNPLVGYGLVIGFSSKNVSNPRSRSRTRSEFC